MKKFKQIINYILFFAICVSVVSTIAISRQRFFTRFDPNWYRGTYESSQFASDVTKRTTFITDWDLYSYAGYRYLQGDDPTSINFEHPPLGKYIIGLSISVFNNENYLQLYGGIVLLFLTFLLAKHAIGNTTISLFVTFLFSLEKIFTQQMTHALLDIWQAVFLYVGIYSLQKIERGKIWMLLLIIAMDGILTTKFFATGIVFILYILGYLLLQKKYLLLKQIFICFVAVLAFYLLVYLPFFITHSFFDFIYLHVKIIKLFKAYVPEYPWGEVFKLLFFGDWLTWWGSKGYVKTEFYNLFWPIITSNIFLIFFAFRKKSIFDTSKSLFLWTIIYLLFTSTHILFPHYLLLILPSLYILLGQTLYCIGNNVIHSTNNHYLKQR